MLADKSSRKREFSDLRSVYKSERSLSPYSRKQSHLSSRYVPMQENTHLKSLNPQFSNSRSVTPVKKREYFAEASGTKTPTKSSRRLNFTTASPLHLVSHDQRGYEEILNKSRQNLKPLEYCLGCTNQYLCEKKKQQRLKRDKEEQKQLIEYQKAHNEQVVMRHRQQETKKNNHYKELLEMNLEQIAEKQQRKNKQRKNQIQNQRKLNTQISQTAKFLKHNEQIRSYKQQAFKKQLLKQIQEDKQRKRSALEQEKKWKPPIHDYTNQLRQKSRNDMRQRQHRIELINQIQQKQEKKIAERQKQKQDEKLQTRRQNYLDQYKRVQNRKNAEYEKQLQNQIINKHINKLKVKQQEDRQFKQMHNAMVEEVQQQAIANRYIEQRKMNRYLSDLKSQIMDNRIKKIKQKQFEKAPAFAPLSQIQRQVLEECDKCHKEYPPKYMSIIEPA